VPDARRNDDVGTTAGREITNPSLPETSPCCRKITAPASTLRALSPATSAGLWILADEVLKQMVPASGAGEGRSRDRLLGKSSGKDTISEGRAGQFHNFTGPNRDGATRVCGLSSRARQILQLGG
jgi:hypothetical protein